MRNVVSRGSQVHHVFHAERAHRGPVIMTTEAKTSPTSHDAAPIASQIHCLVARYAIPAANVTPNASKVTMALGTWMYTIFWTGPMIRSIGARVTIQREAATSRPARIHNHRA